MMIVLLALPVAFVLIGPLMDHLFVPLMNATGGVGSSLQAWFGSGEAAAYRVFFVFAGLLMVTSAVGGWAYPPLRHLERDIPDFDRT
jgi:hypothetical protein